MKEICLVLLRGEAVHYLWPVPDGDSQHVAALSRSAQSISALGWGIDMVIGQASLLSADDVETLLGERWLPAPDADGEALRVPVRNSYEDLKARYEGFITRMGNDGFVAPPPVTVYRKVEYRRATDSARRPVACFSLLKLDGSGFRALDTARKALTVTAMMRRATSDAARASGWPEEKRDAVILGHPAGENRFAYLPVPRIEVRGDAGARRVGLVRRLMRAPARGLIEASSSSHSLGIPASNSTSARAAAGLRIRRICSTRHSVMQSARSAGCGGTA
jgi:CRISPR-associated protein Csb2